MTATPIVGIEMLPGRSFAQKRELVRVVADAVCNIAHARPEDPLAPFDAQSSTEYSPNGKRYIDQERRQR